FFAAFKVASASRKPTVMMLLQPALTISLMLSSNSVCACDSISPSCTPSCSAASSRPSCEVWLNDLSSKPPSSETMQALKSGWLSVGVDSVGSSDALWEAVGVGSSADELSSSRSPHAVSARDATMMAAATRAVFFTAVLLNLWWGCAAGGQHCRQPFS